MPCSLCGDICHCAFEVVPAAISLFGVSGGPGPALVVSPEAASREMVPGVTALCVPSVEPVAQAIAVNGTGLAEAVEQTEEEDPSAWRREVAARLNRYQSRRKPRPPRYPSLRLSFETEAKTSSTTQWVEEFTSTPIAPILSPQALALDRDIETIEPASEAPAELFGIESSIANLPVQAAPTTAKIIEFPRSWTPVPPPLDQLAEPVITHPRILEVPEFAPPPPALGGITIEPAKQPEQEKRPGIDIPLQGAHLARRLVAAAVDDLVIGAACAVFGGVFWKLTATRPPLMHTIAFFAGLAAVFWVAYQYLLVVYAGTTPGLRLARLEVTRFDGSLANRRLRRWRILASFLSAVSLGMGYAWVFLDEDSLCWHDRITRTYLARRMKMAA
jgi:hypothetical protein